MQILTKAAFLELPAGTIYSNFTPYAIDALYMKGENVGADDFYCCSLLDDLDQSNFDDFMVRCDQARAGKDMPLLFNETEGREGYHDATMLYAVWSTEDVRRFALLLQATPALARITSPLQSKPTNGNGINFTDWLVQTGLWVRGMKLEPLLIGDAAVAWEENQDPYEWIKARDTPDAREAFIRANRLKAKFPNLPGAPFTIKEEADQRARYLVTQMSPFDHHLSLLESFNVEALRTAAASVSDAARPQEHSDEHLAVLERLCSLLNSMITNKQKRAPALQLMPFNRWLAAAGIHVPDGEKPALHGPIYEAWRRGEDPTEWRAESSNGEKLK